MLEAPTATRGGRGASWQRLGVEGAAIAAGIGALLTALGAIAIAIRCAKIGIPADTALSAISVPQFVSVGVRAVVLPVMLTTAALVPVVLYARRRQRHVLLPHTPDLVPREADIAAFRRGITLLAAGLTVAAVLLLPVMWSMVPLALLPIALLLLAYRHFRAGRRLDPSRLTAEGFVLFVVFNFVVALTVQLDPPPQFDPVRAHLVDGTELKGLLVAETDAAAYIAVGQTLRIVPIERVDDLTVVPRPKWSMTAPLAVLLVRLL